MKKNGVLDEARLLTNSDVARLAGITPIGVIYHERLGHLRAIKTTRGMRLYQAREVQRWLKQRAVAAREKR